MKIMILAFLIEALCGLGFGGDKPMPKVCLRIDDNINNVVSSQLTQFREALLRPYQKQKLDVSVCPTERQVIEVRYSVDILRSDAKTIYRTDNIPGGAITTPEEVPAHSYGFWHLRLYVAQDSGEVCGGFNVDECSERVAKSLRKKAKQLQEANASTVSK